MKHFFNVGDLVCLNEYGKKWSTNTASEQDYPNPNQTLIYIGRNTDLYPNGNESTYESPYYTCFIIEEARYCRNIDIGEIELYEKD